jgi:N-carbamoyl-L-amino-acid hydrolase
MMLRVNEQRFLQDLAELAQMGRVPASAGGGLDRRPFSPAERAARDYFYQQAEAAGLEVTTDAAANLSARLLSNNPAANTLLLGSHLDTVPNGGPYDGALGVVAALEVLLIVAESGLSLPVHLEAIAFTDEEGRFGDLFGSLALIGGHTSESIEDFLTRASEFPDDLAAMRELVPGGLKPQAVPSARREPDTLAGYLELHIEQGPRLEQAGLPIGIVEAIFGRRSMEINFCGRSDHAGTTPLDLRADALLAAARFIDQAAQLVSHDFPQAVVTCGKVTVKPGVYNVVPGEAKVWLEFRAASASVLSQIEQLLDILAEKCTAAPDLSFTIQPVDRLEPVAMHPTIRTAIGHACAQLGYASTSLFSGAAHDAQALASITPTGMIFVPSRGGRSHCPDEDTDPADLIAGANVLLHTVLTLAQEKTTS